jgi:uncharacterized protein with PIN domain/sulfur carrier protein ThiS
MSHHAMDEPRVRSAVMIEASVRVYGSLNDFLPPGRRHVPSLRVVDRPTTVKDLIEGLGVPHPEIDLILVHGTAVPFDYIVRSGDRIAVFPRFTSVDIGSVTLVRPLPPATMRFVADVHLGKLARRLPLAGLDTAYGANHDDAALADLASREDRVLLTRDQALLKRRTIAYGSFVRTTDPRDQFVEVLRRFGPLDFLPFSRCLQCNGLLREVPKSSIEALRLPRTRRDFDRFEECAACGRLYWKGSHWARLTQILDAARLDAVS